MTLSDGELRGLLHQERYPRSSTYDPRWVLENEMGPNALWLTEWLGVTAGGIIVPGMLSGSKNRNCC